MLHTNPVEIILWRTLAIFLLIGALLGTHSGCYSFSAAAFNAGQSYCESLDFNQTYSSISGSQHRHRILVLSASPRDGFAGRGGAAYIFIYFGILFDKAHTLQSLSRFATPRLLSWLLDALVLVSLIGSTVAFIVGLFLSLRPSLLRGIEENANRWVTTPSTSQVLDTSHDQVEQFVVSHARPVGWLLLLASLYLFFAMSRWLV